MFSIIKEGKLIRNPYLSQARRLIIIIILYCLIECTDNQSPSITHITKYTNCTITFQSNKQPNNKLNESIKNENDVLSFKGCVKQICLRNLINGNCVNIQKFNLDNEALCYAECCGSQRFDFLQCQAYNQHRQTIQKSAEQKLAIMLTAVALFLIIAIVIFLVFYIQCCINKNYPNKVEATTNKQNRFYWKSSVFKNKQKCQICSEIGGFIMHPCGRFYHLKCLKNIEVWDCKHCAKKIKNVKVYCPICEKRSILVKANNYYQMDREILEMYQFHPERCLQFMGDEMETERKFTQSTKQ